MKLLLFIAFGGALGAVMRYLATGWVNQMTDKGFPYGTLFVNVTGSLLIGLLTVYLLDKASVSDEMRAGLLVGVLGSFTTFSTFSMDTLSLFEQGAMTAAFMNIVLSVTVCLAAVWLGMVIGRQL